MNKKICTKCKIEKFISEFGKEKRVKSGIQSQCRNCTYGYTKRYRKTLQGRASQKKYKQSQKGKKSYKKYYLKHTEKIKKCQEIYELSGKPAQNRKKYRCSEKGKMSNARGIAKRRSLTKNVINNLTLNQWQEILLLQENACNICNVSFDNVTATRDHIIPVSKGGGLTKENVQALCQCCNSSKGNKIMKEYTKLEVQ